MNVARGESHYKAVLTDADVVLIREAVNERRRLLDEASRLSDRALAEKFGVHKNTIWKVAHGPGWAHVAEG